MEKYGILHEMKCKCGRHAILDEKGNVIELIKEGGAQIPVEMELSHEWEEVLEDGRTESKNIRSEQHPREN